MPRIAALITCHNRRQKTLACLDSLFRILPEVEVYLTDDGCSDGTREAVLAHFPSVVVISGTGNLYWSRGMYIAWREAIKRDYDYYLWLNDDLELYDNFYQELTTCCPGDDSIVTGLVEDFSHTRILYGGYDAQNRLVQAASTPQPVRRMNGNVVLVPRSVVRQIGIIDPRFQHDLGDVDYSLRAHEQGIAVWSTRMPVAAGYENLLCRERKAGVSLVQRFRVLNSPLGSPLSLNFYFRRKHFGLFHALAYDVKLILINLLPDSLYLR